MNSQIISKKILSGEIDKNFLLKDILIFNIRYIIPIIYKNSNEDKFDIISKKEAKLEFLNNSIK